MSPHFYLAPESYPEENLEMLMNVWLSVLILWSVAFGAQRSLAGEHGSFVLHEYWTCESDRMGALRESAKDVWAPIFGSLVDDGMLLGWGHLNPTGATRYASAEAAGADSTPDHDWFAWFETTSSDANEAMWEQFGKRLREHHPSDPRPWLYCDSLTTVSYQK